MLESSLHFLNVICAASDVDIRLLRVLHAQSITASLIVTLPSSMALLEVLTSFTNRNAYVLVVELGAVKL